MHVKLGKANNFHNNLFTTKSNLAARDAHTHNFCTHVFGVSPEHVLVRNVVADIVVEALKKERERQRERSQVGTTNYFHFHYHSSLRPQGVTCPPTWTCRWTDRSNYH